MICPDCGCEMKPGTVRAVTMKVGGLAWDPEERQQKALLDRLTTDLEKLGDKIPGYRCPLCNKIILDSK